MSLKPYGTKLGMAIAMELASHATTKRLGEPTPAPALPLRDVEDGQLIILGPQLVAEDIVKHLPGDLSKYKLIVAEDDDDFASLCELHKNAISVISQIPARGITMHDYEAPALAAFLEMNSGTGGATKVDLSKISGTLPTPPTPNGLKYFPEYDVWALNEKNAIRKSKKK